MSEEAVKVFISYSWDSSEHKEKVLALSDSLRKHGIDCQIDRYHQSPPQGWYRWMMDQIEESDFVLVVCTEKYNLRYRNKEERGQGRGVTWEGGQIIAELYGEQGINDKFIPVLLSPEGGEHIPRSLQTYTVYRLLSNADYDLNKQGDYQNLYRYLTKQPAHVPAQLGKPQKLPPISGAASTVGDQGEIIQAEDSTIAKEQAEREEIQLEQQRQAEEEERLRQAEQLRQQQAVEAERLKQEEDERKRLAQLEQINPPVPAPDNTGGDYAQLEALLKASKWEEANQETGRQMRQVMGLKEKDWLQEEHIEKIPCADLRTIDQLWRQHSGGKFGFSVQKKIWQQHGSPKKYGKQWEEFGEAVGWRSEGLLGFGGEWKSLSALTYSFSAPKGHLPTFGAWYIPDLTLKGIKGRKRFIGEAVYYLSRCETCGL